MCLLKMKTSFIKCRSFPASKDLCSTDIFFNSRSHKTLPLPAYLVISCCDSSIFKFVLQLILRSTCLYLSVNQLISFFIFLWGFRWQFWFLCTSNYTFERIAPKRCTDLSVSTRIGKHFFTFNLMLETVYRYIQTNWHPLQTDSVGVAQVYFKQTGNYTTEGTGCTSL